jgi:predicted nucleic acid-binding Zn ribbon protein
MYCAACGTPLAPGLSFCNRCGMSLKERGDSKIDPIGAYLISAITVVGIGGLGLILGGAIALKNGAQFHEELIGIFMLMSFFIVAFVEIFLCRQLSRLNTAAEKRQGAGQPLQGGMPMELRGPQQRALAEPVPSVTENTTRTLEYSRDKSQDK